MALPSGMKNRPATVVGGGTLDRRIALMFAYRGDTVRISHGQRGVVRGPQAARAQHRRRQSLARRSSASTGQT